MQDSTLSPAFGGPGPPTYFGTRQPLETGTELREKKKRVRDKGLMDVETVPLPARADHVLLS